MSIVHRIRRWAGREPGLASHLIGILLTMMIVVTAHFTVESEWAYFLRHMSVLSAWGGVCVLLQQLINWSRMPGRIRVVWAATDVLFFTWILYMADPPRGPLLVGYSLLIAASGLFNRVQLVALTTVLTVLAFIMLMVWSPGEIDKPHFCAIFVVGLLVLGGIVGGIVRRHQLLRQYYEKGV